MVKYALGEISDSSGLDLNNCCLILWSLINIIQTISMVFISSIMLAFPETEQFSFFFHAQVVSLVLYLLDIVLNFTSQRY